MRLPRSAGLLPLLLAGCATTLPHDATRVHYRCDHGRRMTVTYGPGAWAQLQTGTLDLRLPQARAASGIRYVADGLTLWSKGAGAFVERAGQPWISGCHALDWPPPEADRPQNRV
jgi:Predicted periplasmic protein